jgi:hypothetical protein
MLGKTGHVSDGSPETHDNQSSTRKLGLVGNHGGFQTGAWLHEPGQYWQYLNQSYQSGYVACGDLARCSQPLCPSEAHATPRKTLYAVGDADLFVRITLPMDLCQPATELFFGRDDRGSDLVSGVVKFPLQNRALSRTTIEFNEMIGVQDQLSNTVILVLFANFPSQTDHLVKSRVVGRHAECSPPILLDARALDELFQMGQFFFESRNAFLDSCTHDDNFGRRTRW